MKVNKVTRSVHSLKQDDGYCIVRILCYQLLLPLIIEEEQCDSLDCTSNEHGPTSVEHWQRTLTSSFLHTGTNQENVPCVPNSLSLQTMIEGPRRLCKYGYQNDSHSSEAIESDSSRGVQGLTSFSCIAKQKTVFFYNPRFRSNGRVEFYELF